MYNFFVVNTTIVINVLYNRWNGPGGGTRHLHGGELGFDVRGKARLLLEVVLRKGIKRSANSTKMVMLDLGVAMALLGLPAIVANCGSFVRRRRKEETTAAIAVA